MLVDCTSHWVLVHGMLTNVYHCVNKASQFINEGLANGKLMLSTVSNVLPKHVTKQNNCTVTGGCEILFSSLSMRVMQE